MPTISDYLLQTTATGLTSPKVGFFVRFTNNVTGAQFISTTFTDSNGVYTVASVPAGTYTVASGPTNTGPFTNTGDNNYAVGQTTGDHFVSSGAAPTISNVIAGITGTPTVIGNDQAFLVTLITTGSPPAANSNLFNVNFATAYAFIPAVLATVNAIPGGILVFAAAGVTTTTFVAICASTLPASSTITVAYFMIQPRVV